MLDGADGAGYAAEDADQHGEDRNAENHRNGNDDGCIHGVSSFQGVHIHTLYHIKAAITRGAGSLFRGAGSGMVGIDKSHSVIIYVIDKKLIKYTDVIEITW